MNYSVDLTSVRKDLKKLPKHITDKLIYWVHSVEMLGLTEVRKNKGFHDEPLKGKRKGQRSVRLSKAYRAIYEVYKSNEVKIVVVLEVNKHEY